MNLTEEQIDILKKTYIDLALSAMKFQEEVMKAFVPVIEATSAFYESIPEEMRNEIAAAQVDDMLKQANIDALKTIDPKKHYIALKLDEYSKYWNQEKQIYVVPDPNDSINSWTPTRDELIEDLGKSYDLEHGDKS